jgi:hypothetical protein
MPSQREGQAFASLSSTADILGPLHRTGRPVRVGHSTYVLVMTARLAGYAVGNAVIVDEEAVMGKQTLNQVARLAASQVQAKHRRERPKLSGTSSWLTP